MLNRNKTKFLLRKEWIPSSKGTDSSCERNRFLLREEFTLI